MEKNITVVEKELQDTVYNHQNIGLKLVVINDRDKEVAVGYLKEIKTLKKKAKDFLEPSKKSAYATYKEISDRLKELVEPLDRAESIVKSKLKDYELILLTEKREREAKAEAKRLELEKKQTEALDNKDIGTLFEIENEIEEVVEEAKEEKSTINGVHTRSTFKAIIEDPDIVPISVSGIMIRPIDEKALNRLAKVSQGNMEIPGVKFIEDIIIVNR